MASKRGQERLKGAGLSPDRDGFEHMLELAAAASAFGTASLEDVEWQLTRMVNAGFATDVRAWKQALRVAVEEAKRGVAGVEQ
eukprot:3236779-Rhodomonas_salina.1